MNSVPCFSGPGHRARAARRLLGRVLDTLLNLPPQPEGFRTAVLELSGRAVPELVRIFEREYCADSFGQAVLGLDWQSLRRGRYVTALPQMERDGLPCEILYLDLTGRAPVPEDLPDLEAFLDFYIRFHAPGSLLFFLVSEQGQMLADLLSTLTLPAGQLSPPDGGPLPR